LKVDGLVANPEMPIAVLETQLLAEVWQRFATSTVEMEWDIYRVSIIDPDSRDGEKYDPKQ
jgi:hypothetical protein